MALIDVGNAVEVEGPDRKVLGVKLDDGVLVADKDAGTCIDY